MAALGRGAVTTFPTLVPCLTKKDRPSPGSTNNRRASISCPPKQAFSTIALKIRDIRCIQPKFQWFGADDGFFVDITCYEGSVLIIGDLLTSWCRNTLETAPERLSSFRIIWASTKKLEIFILKVGYTPPVDELKRFVRSTGMKLEVVCSGADHGEESIYHIFNEEGRIVSAALLSMMFWK